MSHYRQFGGIDKSIDPVRYNGTTPVNAVSQHKAQELRNGILGAYKKFTSPFGEKPIIYADWTASSRCVERIERYMVKEVVPFYGNTHTTTSITGHQSTCYRDEARQIIAECVNAKVTGKAAEDIVIFVGQGTTSAVNKLVGALGLQDTFFPSDQDNQFLRPVVFHSAYEHHSNLLPWRESCAIMVAVDYDPSTGVSLNDLEDKLIQYQQYRVKLGTFSAASNITGILTDVDSVSILIHKYGGLVFFDYATAAPYLKIDMNPVFVNGEKSSLAYKDAVFFSGHKFLGGPGCPGVLVVKKFIMPQASETPATQSGGGTVFYVTEDYHRYLANREEREEGGSPQVLGDVKMGLVMHCLREIGFSWIEQQEHEIEKRVFDRLSADERIVLLGKGDSVGKALPIFSFLIRCQDRFLHFHFVSVLLNDLFGIQSRGGCMCAGPFAQRLLGLDSSANEAIEAALLDKHEVLRPGFTRLSFSYWMPSHEVDYIINAILFVAEHGWKFLAQYRYNYKTGEWAHTTRLTRFPERKWLSNFSIMPTATTVGISESAMVMEDPESSSSSLAQILSSDWEGQREEDVLNRIFIAAQDALSKLELSRRSGKAQSASSVNHTEGAGIGAYDSLRWFVLPDSIKALETSDIQDLKGPIDPSRHSSASSAAERSGVAGAAGAGAGAGAGAANVTMTLYADTRDKKIARHRSDDIKIPRYLSIFTHANENDNLSKVLRDNAYHALKSFSAIDGTKEFTVDSGSTREFVASDQVPEFSRRPSNHRQQTDQSESIVPERASTSIAAGVEAPAQEECSLMNTCSIRETTSQRPTTTLSANGKILSGPGNYFPASRTVTGKLITPPKKIMKLVGQAVKEWGMIEEGDRLLLGLSGGKDSLALMHTLIALQKRAPVKFEIACATVDPQTASFDPSPLIPYVQSLGITYHYLSEPIVELAKSKLQGDSLCAFCSRFKRGLLYSCCRTFGYNKLVLAQHLDDLVESFMMSALHNGQIRTMKANYKIDAGDVRVIRPFIYIRESTTRDFSQAASLPIINENCPACFEQPKERARMKKLMAQEEAMVPALFHNMKRALIPLMHDDTYAAMNKVAADVENAGYRSKQVQHVRVPSSKRTRSEYEIAGAGMEKEEKDEEVAEGDSLSILEKLDKALTDVDNAKAACDDSNGYCVPCFELL